MDHNSMNQHQHLLGVNKLGRNIRKSPNHQPNFHRIPSVALNQQQPTPPSQPRVYNINKSDFRSVVQQLTGSPNRDSNGDGFPLARPPQPKNPSSRLKKIRPPPLTPISRPPPPPFQNHVLNPNPNLNPNHVFYRPAPSPSAPGSAVWTDSPVSAYMKYLESSLLTSDSSRQQQQLQQQQPALLPSPAWQFPLISPSSQFPLSSPNSQFPLPSPSSFLNVISPKSPYPLVSPRFQYSIPLTPNFSYSPLPHQSGMLGPSPGFQTLPSPSNLFPLSPSGSLPFLSPRWKEM